MEARELRQVTIASGTSMLEEAASCLEAVVEWARWDIHAGGAVALNGKGVNKGEGCYTELDTWIH